jgi:biotin carboxylase
MNDRSAAPDIPSGIPKALVVGTTADYIQWIRHACPGRALFLTHPRVRHAASEPLPDPSEELLWDLSDMSGLIPALYAHLETFNQTPTGIACFDCESMAPSAHLAAALDLTYPHMAAIENCRDKQVSKQLWQAEKIPCPRVWPVHCIDDVLTLLPQTFAGLVLKPAKGSGSELVFQCRNRAEAEAAFPTLAAGLKKRRGNPLFGLTEGQILAEERICGPEYSSDFILTPEKTTLIRLTRKIKPAGLPFGTAAGYEIPAALPPQLSMTRLAALLGDAARALGLDNGICMVDFVMKNNFPCLIEMTPRPGGDCLPWLLKIAGNLDILKLTLDVAQNKPWDLTGMRFAPHMGIRIHAKKSGILKAVHSHALASDPRVRQLEIRRLPGHVITLPPKDYDSWLLGHVIIDTQGWNFPETRAMMLAGRLNIEIRP